MTKLLPFMAMCLQLIAVIEPQDHGKNVSDLFFGTFQDLAYGLHAVRADIAQYVCQR